MLMKNNNMEVTTEELRRIKEEDEARFNALYADEDGNIDEEYYEEELKRGEQYHLHWDGCESIVYSNFKEIEEAFYDSTNDGVAFKMDGFQAGQILFTRKKGKEWSIFD